MADISAFVVAGGKSVRMGADKAFVKLARRTLLDHALELARSVNPAPVIVGPAATFSAFAPVIEDVFPGQGPLAAIHAALRSSPTDLNLMLAVDVPFVTPAFLAHLCQRAASGTTVVSVPRSGGRWHPLCAVYRRSFADRAEPALRLGRNKIDALFAGVSTLTLEEQELRDLGFDPAMFRNLNTPEDVSSAEAGAKAD